MKKLLVILGPTGTGKTDLALSLAKKFNGELVAADSRQVYRGLDIGTGKLPSGSTYEVRRTGPRRSLWEIGGIRIWMYDVVGLKKQYTVADYVHDASKVIIDIQKRGKLPIIVGGTGLYIRALLDGLNNLSIPVDFSLRKELGELSLEELQLRIKKISPKVWKNLNQSDRQNPRRLLRSIELKIMDPYIRSQKIEGLNKKFDVLKIGLITSRQELFKKSDSRVLDWFDNGIIEEVKGLVKNGISLKRFEDLGLEYKIVAQYLKNKIDKKSLVSLSQTALRGYIKRQLTWFKKDMDINWFDIIDQKFHRRVEILVAKWYDLSQYANKN